MLTPAQVEELFDAARRVSTHATEASVFAHVTFPAVARAAFPAELDKSLDELSLVLNKYEPAVKALKTALANIREVLVALGDNGKIESGSVESAKLRATRDLLDYCIRPR